MLRPSKKRNRLAEAITIVIELYDKKILSPMDSPTILLVNNPMPIFHMAEKRHTKNNIKNNAVESSLLDTA